MKKNDQFYERDELTDFVTIVSKPIEEDLLEDEVKLLKHPVPVHQPEQLEVEDVSFLKCHETWQGCDAVQYEVAFDVFQLSISELPIYSILVLLLG